MRTLERWYWPEGSLASAQDPRPPAFSLPSWPPVRQLVTESLLLAGLSGACALVLSAVLLKVIQLQHNSGVAIGLFPGWSVLGSTAGMAVVAALVFGLPSALRLTSLVPGSGRFRTIFLGTQVAVSCLLLVVSSLLVSNIQRLRSADPGLDYNHLVWISPGLKAHGYSAQAAEAYLDMLRTRTSQIPGVRATSVVWLPPWGDSHAAEGWSGRQFATNHVDANFLNTMNLQLVRGRNFLPGEERVALVTEAAARLLWPDTDAIDERRSLGQNRPTVIVGNFVTSPQRKSEQSNRLSSMCRARQPRPQTPFWCSTSQVSPWLTTSLSESTCCPPASTVASSP